MNDSHRDDRPQNRYDVKGRVRHPEGRHHAEQRKQRPHPDGQRLQKCPELQHQHRIHQHECGDEHERQIPKGLLLLLIQSPKLDCGIGGETDCPSEFLLNGGDAVTQPAAANAA